MEDVEKKWKELVKEHLRIKELSEHTSYGSEMRFLTPYLEAMTYVSASKTLPPSYAYFFLSQCFSTLNMDKEESEVGFIGKDLSRVIQSFSKALLSETFFLTEPDLTTKMLLERIVKSLFILSISMGHILSLQLNQLERKGEIAKIELMLGLKLIESSSILKTTLKEFLGALSVKDQIRENLTEVLSFLVMNLICFNAIKDKKEFEKFAELFSKEFIKSLKLISNLFETRLTASDKNKTSTLQAAITEAIISLDTLNYENYLDAIDLLLSHSQTSFSNFMKDSCEVQQMAEKLYTMISTELEESSKSQTEIAIIV